MRESNVVTKIFEVEFVAVPHTMPEDDDLGFQEEIDKERSQVRLYVTDFYALHEMFAGGI